MFTGKDRPRRGNVKLPARRTADGALHDSSSDGGLDNDDNSIGDVPTISITETPNENQSNPSTATELPPK